MKKRKGGIPVGLSIGIPLIIFFLILHSPMPALAKEAHLSDIVVTSTRDHLLVYFGVVDCFTEDMMTAIESGLDTTFTFFIRLYEKRGFWLDRKIADIKVKHSIKYNNLKKNYELRLSEQNNKTIVLKDFDEAKELMAEVVALKVTPLHTLKKGVDYRLRMMAELDKIILPFYLHRIFFALSLWDFETDWYSIDFQY
jgi:hypothetical protein